MTTEEVFELTGYRRASRQLQSLQSQGIRAWPRADGSIAVLRSQFTGANAEAPLKPESTAMRKPVVQVTDRRRQR